MANATGFSGVQPVAHATAGDGDLPELDSGRVRSVREREDTLNRIKCALVTAPVTLESSPNRREHGANPYDSHMGASAPRDIWNRSGRR